MLLFNDKTVRDLLEKIFTCYKSVSVFKKIFVSLISEPHYVFKTETVMFREAGDWGKEMARTECQGWRLSGVNHDFQMSTRCLFYVYYYYFVVNILFMVIGFRTVVVRNLKSNH